MGFALLLVQYLRYCKHSIDVKIGPQIRLTRGQLIDTAGILQYNPIQSAISRNLIGPIFATELDYIVKCPQYKWGGANVWPCSISPAMSLSKGTFHGYTVFIYWSQQNTSVLNSLSAFPMGGTT